jgi:serine protease Do
MDDSFNPSRSGRHVGSETSPDLFSPNWSAPEHERPRAAQQPRPTSRISGTPSLLWLLAILILLLSAPLLVRQFNYQAEFGRLKAGYDVATGALSELKPRLNDLELASRLVAKRVEPSVVSIFPRGERQFRGMQAQDVIQGQGSGVIVDTEGYIITNHHVIDGADSIQVELSDGRRANAEVVGDDTLTDLAVLKIDLPNLIAAEWGDSEELQVGDLVWALGSPFGLQRSLTFGIVSAKARRGAAQGLFQEYLQTDAAVNPGNSGGPLVNIEGQIVGINAAIVGPSFQGISFAIPSTLAHEEYDRLRKNGSNDRAWLGAAPVAVPERLREAMKLPLGQGVLLRTVVRNQPADKAGLKPGDIILEWNGFQTDEPMLLSRKIASTEIGSVANVTIARPLNASGEFETIKLQVTMERRPPNP